MPLDAFGTYCCHFRAVWHHRLPMPGHGLERPRSRMASVLVGTFWFGTVELLHGPSALCRANDNEASLNCWVSFSAGAVKCFNRTCTAHRYNPARGDCLMPAAFRRTPGGQPGQRPNDMCDLFRYKLLHGVPLRLICFCSSQAGLSAVGRDAAPGLVAVNLPRQVFRAYHFPSPVRDSCFLALTAHKRAMQTDVGRNRSLPTRDRSMQTGQNHCVEDTSVAVRWPSAPV